jgi:hypothetical protein
MEVCGDGAPQYGQAEGALSNFRPKREDKRLQYSGDNMPHHSDKSF